MQGVCNEYFTLIDNRGKVGADAWQKRRKKCRLKLE